MKAIVPILTALRMAGHATVGDPKLWYSRPAADWHEALSLGNWRLGPMAATEPHL